MVIDFQVSEQDACVQGHFPGAPVVPGAYLLAKIDLTLRQLFPEQRLKGFSKVKFLAPILPGSEERKVQLMVEPSVKASDRVQVSILCDGQIMLQATGILGG